jgi:hypothetical protein
MIPRYEFRAFAQGFGSTADRLRSRVPCDEIRESRETYFVTTCSADHNVKVRTGSLDIKQLVGRRQGLEQWKPIFQEPFPVSIDAARSALCPALGIAESKFERPAYSFEQLVSEIVRPCPELVAVHVFKRRFRFTLGRCPAEIDELLINGAAIQSLAIESEAGEAVLAAVRDLGVAAYGNVNYPLALRRIVGLEPWPEDTWWL